MYYFPPFPKLGSGSLLLMCKCVKKTKPFFSSGSSNPSESFMLKKMWNISFVNFHSWR